MAKRSTPKTKVKDHRFDVPLAGVSSRKATAQVLIDPETGIFEIALPSEVVALLKCQPTVSGRDMNSMLYEFQRTLEKYGAIVRTQDRTKVIVIRYKKNWPGRVSDGGIANFSVGMEMELGGRFSFDDTPNLGMALDYEILWSISDRGIFEIYFNDDGTPAGDPERRYGPNPKGAKVLPWSEEREAFFRNMREGLGAMIERMNHFFADDYIANIDRAIANGGNGLALPARQPALPSPEGNES